MQLMAGQGMQLFRFDRSFMLRYQHHRSFGIQYVETEGRMYCWNKANIVCRMLVQFEDLFFGDVFVSKGHLQGLSSHDLAYWYSHIKRGGLPHEWAPRDYAGTNTFICSLRDGARLMQNMGSFVDQDALATFLQSDMGSLFPCSLDTHALRNLAQILASVYVEVWSKSELVIVLGLAGKKVATGPLMLLHRALQEVCGMSEQSADSHVAVLLTMQNFRNALLHINGLQNFFNFRLGLRALQLLDAQGCSEQFPQEICQQFQVERQRIGLGEFENFLKTDSPQDDFGPSFKSACLNAGQGFWKPFFTALLTKLSSVSRQLGSAITNWTLR